MLGRRHSVCGRGREVAQPSRPRLMECSRQHQNPVGRTARNEGGTARCLAGIGVLHSLPAPLAPVESLSRPPSIARASSPAPYPPRARSSAFVIALGQRAFGPPHPFRELPLATALRLQRVPPAKGFFFPLDIASAHFLLLLRI